VLPKLKSCFSLGGFIHTLGIIFGSCYLSQKKKRGEKKKKGRMHHSREPPLLGGAAQHPAVAIFLHGRRVEKRKKEGKMWLKRWLITMAYRVDLTTIRGGKRGRSGSGFIFFGR